MVSMVLHHTFLAQGAKSELNMSRLGTNEKVRLDTMEGIASMPAEWTRGLKVKPNREKISQILKIDSVIDLQRQLLTSVMENEVSLPYVMANSDLISAIWLEI